MSSTRFAVSSSRSDDVHTSVTSLIWRMWQDSRTYTTNQCSNCRGVGGVEPPYLTLPTPPPLVKIKPPPSSFTPHLSFAEVGMLLDSHFLLMQFLKYLGLHHDDLNVTTSWFIVQTRVILSRIVR